MHAPYINPKKPNENKIYVIQSVGAKIKANFNCTKILKENFQNKLILY